MGNNHKIPARNVQSGKTSEQTVGQICRDIDLNAFRNDAGALRSAERSYNPVCDRPLAEILNAAPTSSDMGSSAGELTCISLVGAAVCVAARVTHARAFRGTLSSSETAIWGPANHARVLSEWTMTEWLGLLETDQIEMLVSRPEPGSTFLLSDGGPLLDEHDGSGWSQSYDPRPWPSQDWVRARRPPRGTPPRALRVRLAIRPDILISWSIVGSAQRRRWELTEMNATEVQDFNQQTVDRALTYVFGPETCRNPWPY